MVSDGGVMVTRMVKNGDEKWCKMVSQMVKNGVQDGVKMVKW